MNRLVTGNNQLTIVSNIADLPTGVTRSYVYPDYFDLSYRAFTQLAPGTASIHLEAMDDGVERVRVSGFASGTGNSVRVFDLRAPNQPVEILTKQTLTSGGTDQVDFWDQPLPSPSYFATSGAAFQTPARIELDLPSTLQSPANNADYIAIVPSMVWEAPVGKLGIDDLLAHRQGEGLQVAKVRLQDIYDEWSYGRVDPEAIRSFLTYAYFNWNSGGGTAYLRAAGWGRSLRLQGIFPELRVQPTPAVARQRRPVHPGDGNGQPLRQRRRAERHVARYVDRPPTGPGEVSPRWYIR